MFIPFNIKSGLLEKITSSGNYSYDTTRIKEQLERNINLDNIKQRLINGTRLQEEWFPSEFYDSQFEIFISHAHKDEDLIKSFAGFLYDNYGLRSFIDSCYWGYANKLQRQLDEWYGSRFLNGMKLYNYEITQFTSANVHIMLSMALQKMMDSCECLIFVDSENSLNYKKGQPEGTPSPWIYEEIGFSERLRINVPERYKTNIQIQLNESREHSSYCFMCFSATESHVPQFNYEVDRKAFKELYVNDFPMCKFDGIRMLDRWYSKYDKKQLANRIIGR